MKFYKIFSPTTTTKKKTAFIYNDIQEGTKESLEINQIKT